MDELVLERLLVCRTGVEVVVRPRVKSVELGLFRVARPSNILRISRRHGYDLRVTAVDIRLHARRSCYCTHWTHV